MLDSWHTTYHEKLTHLVRNAQEHYDDVILIDLHSMPDNPDRPSKKKFLHATSRRLPDFVFGNLHGATLKQKTVGRIDRVMGHTRFSWKWNTPYAGGYITRHYGLAAEENRDIPPVEVLQIEVNRRLYTSQKNTNYYGKIRAVKKVIESIVFALTDR